ncbi:MAG: hypothetical protein HUJ72_10920 [Blautia sp.]|nr:hypothetical protein [Blautia sp.]
MKKTRRQFQKLAKGLKKSIPGDFFSIKSVRKMRKRVKHLKTAGKLVTNRNKITKAASVTTQVAKTAKRVLDDRKAAQ